MAIRLTVKNNVSPKKYRAILNNKALWVFGAAQWHRLYTPFTPMQSGQLANNIKIEPKRILHLVPYSKAMYYGEQYNFRKDKHAKATSRWDKAAKPTQFKKLVRAMDAYIKRKGLLNG